jgi:hypothetical protein
MKRYRMAVTVTIISLLIASTPAQSQIGGWDVGIDFPQDDDSNPFSVNEDGAATVDFFVYNDELLPITVEFEYEIPFEGEADGPESENIASGGNKSFTLAITGIDVWAHQADSKEDFTITVTLVSRASIPQPLPESKFASGELQIPRVYSLEVDVSDPVGPMNAGSEMSLQVTVRNNGNVNDRVGSIEVSDNCPLLTTDNGLDILTTRDIQSGQKTEASITISASQSHPQRKCDLEVTISSNGAANTGGSDISNDEARITVEPPPANEEQPEEPDDPNQTVEIVSSNLPFTGSMLTISMLILAVFSVKKRS